jgi:hypothetical protein
MDEQINAFAPETNEYVSFPAEFLDAAIAQGYRVATPEDKQRQLKKEIIETNNPVLSRVAATLVPAADTATFGALGAGLKNVAPDLAEIADITQESHPNLATAGTVAGFAGSFVALRLFGHVCGLAFFVKKRWFSRFGQYQIIGPVCACCAGRRCSRLSGCSIFLALCFAKSVA